MFVRYVDAKLPILLNLKSHTLLKKQAEKVGEKKKNKSNPFCCTLYFPRISIALIYSDRNLRGKDRKSWSKKKKPQYHSTSLRLICITFMNIFTIFFFMSKKQSRITK